MRKLTMTLPAVSVAALVGCTSTQSSSPQAKTGAMPIEPVPIILPAAAGDHLVDVDANDVALGGYDPVVMRSEGKLAKGLPENQFKHEGATYLFTTDQNRQIFASDSERFAPKFGGFCAVAASMGHVERGDPHFWNLYDGRLVLNKNEKAAMMFRKDPGMFVKKAEDNWPKLLQALGKQ